MTGEGFEDLGQLVRHGLIEQFADQRRRAGGHSATQPSDADAARLGESAACIGTLLF